MITTPFATSTTAAVESMIANATSTSAPSPTGTPSLETAPTPSNWTIDSAILWLVTVFYFSVSAASLAYFVSRWRQRVYGTDRVLLRGGSGVNGGGAGYHLNASREGLLASIAAMIERVTSSTTLSGAAAWQPSESAQHRSAMQSTRSLQRGGGAAGMRGLGQKWLKGLSPLSQGSQARRAAAKRNTQKFGDHHEGEVFPTVWCDEGGAGGTDYVDTIGCSAVPPCSIAPTIVAREQQQQR
ncbi:hypothetical protein JKF63_05591 [Porcisia hertigi]|uniref:Uncharacterized protein n=1 Tax=Porcisia hertigi TaxID=2761500 RepID=A0A836LAY8_9TRYP|nr:hypothetical protein JKF63_05591 [Porcisia hertigi]